MEATKYIWKNGKFIKWADAKTHVLTHTLHYGTGAFEGIRVYETKSGCGIFHLKKHFERLKFSCDSVGLVLPYSVKQLMDATVNLIKKNKLKSGYIRPLAYFGFGEVRVIPTNCPPEIIIATWPWGSYLGHEPAKITIVKTLRVHPATTIPGAKLIGNYLNSMLSGREAKARGFAEGLQMDYEGNIAEGSGENFFIVKNGVLITPALGCILPGITRASVIRIARDNGIKVDERKVTKEEAFKADEAFFTGTAAEITPIASIDKHKMKMAPGPITNKIREVYMSATRCEIPKYKQWVTIVK